MTLPASVLESLDTQKISYNVTRLASEKKQSASPSAPSNCIVKSILVQDMQSRMQVLIPADRMLDLDAMLSEFGRSFNGVSSDDIKPLILKHNLNSLPAIPRWQGMPTIVDSSLLKHETLWLDAGDAEQLIEISRDNFEGVITPQNVGTISAPVPNLRANTDNDEAQIHDSLQRFTQLRIQQRLDETLELPPLPETAQRIIRLRADPKSDISDLSNIVEVDPSLAAQVVSWASSPYYSAPGKIKSVHDAIVRVLGFDMVMNLALGLSLGKTLSNKAFVKGQIENYWRGAVYTAAAVEGLVTSISREHRPGFGMAYLAGLLNNFGYLIMAEVFPPYFSNIDRMACANNHLPRAAIEQHLLGVTGSQIASWLFADWNMPQEVVVALRHSNDSQFDGDHCVYAHLIYLAQRMLANAGFGESQGGAIPDELFKQLHLDRKIAEITVANILNSSDDLDAIAEKMRN
ncbi:MAG: HDOD domain-containing protein [Cellvibrionaceae bacterium]|nr:HDOD domain-containing protein [Cellvibrionaceae bacterium]